MIVSAMRRCLIFKYIAGGDTFIVIYNLLIVIWYCTTISRKNKGYTVQNPKIIRTICALATKPTRSAAREAERVYFVLLIFTAPK